jgi:hypothetical protein
MLWRRRKMKAAVAHGGVSWRRRRLSAENIKAGGVAATAKILKKSGGNIVARKLAAISKTLAAIWRRNMKVSAVKRLALAAA